MGNVTPENRISPEEIMTRKIEEHNGMFAA